MFSQVNLFVPDSQYLKCTNILGPNICDETSQHQRSLGCLHNILGALNVASESLDPGFHYTEIGNEGFTKGSCCHGKFHTRNELTRKVSYMQNSNRQFDKSSALTKKSCWHLQKPCFSVLKFLFFVQKSTLEDNVFILTSSQHLT